MVYAKAVSSFLFWIKSVNPTFSTISSTSPEVLDTLLAQYANFLFNENSARGNLQRVVNCKCGIFLWHPRLRSSPFYITEASLRGWNTSVPKNQRSPAPACLVFVMIRMFIKQQQWDSALITWLCFDGYFRISEITEILVRQFNDNGTIIVVNLSRSKTGLNQCVIIQQPQLIYLIRSYFRSLLCTTERLFPSNMQAIYRVSWDAMLRSLKADHLELTPHSLRHAGATEDFISGNRTSEQIFNRGR